MNLQPDMIVELLGIANTIDSQQPQAARLRRRHPRLHDEAILARARIATGIGEFGRERKVVLVDISSGGLQFIWLGFVHKGTTFIFHLQRPGGQTIEIEGHCVWCKHLRHRYHAVGIQMAIPIPLHEIVSQKIWLEACAKNPELQHPVTGRMAIFGQNKLTSQSAVFQVRDSGLTVSVIENRGQLLDGIERNEFDMLVLDADPEDLDVTEFITLCRGRSFNGPMILLSMDSEAEYLANMDPRKCCRFVQLPMQTNAIIAAIRDILSSHPDCILNDKDIYSTAPHTPHRDESLKHFISLAKAMCEEAQRALECEKYGAVVKVAHSLAASGGSHGYADLSIAAMRYLAAARDPSQVKRLPSLLNGIDSIIKRLKPGSPGHAI